MRDGGSGDRIVPPTGFTAQLTLFSAGAMAFLAVFALALALATGRLADRWASELAGSVTVRVSAPSDQQAARTRAAMQVLSTTPGAGQPRLLPPEEVAELLAPWFGPDMPVDALPVPALIDLPVAGDDFDAQGLRLRLEAEAPGAVLDDHTEWRRPLVSAANRLRVLGIVSLLLIGAASAAMITLAAKAALSANGQVIRVLRLIGARDITIATAFVRRFTKRAAIGAAVGTLCGMAGIAMLPGMDAAGGFLTGLGFQDWGWLLPLLIPVVAAAVGFLATRWAALKMLGAVR
ncbi:cell division protein FtsX [Paracoccus sediminis]|nr:cell division protein FtsX [Paracoccus sediminis]